MNSDNHTFHTSSTSLTLVPLGTTFLHAPLLSDELMWRITGVLQKGTKILILYNRRGSGRAWICQDCGYFPLCPQCDIALAYHTTPKRQLICHQCNFLAPLPAHCPQCSGVGFHPVGIGIQRVSDDLHTLSPGSRILRIDSDTELDKSEILYRIEEADIIIGTYAHRALILDESISDIVFLLFESDLTLPDYRMEEDAYHTLEYAKKSGKELLIQTYTPDHPLLSILIEGNYRDFLLQMSQEREKYHYPPYSQFALIRIHDPYKEKVQDIMTKMTNKITLLKSEDIFVASDRDIWEKYAGEWVQKIILKGKNLTPLLSTLEVEIVRNRNISLEWR